MGRVDMEAETFSTSVIPAPQQFDAWMNWFDGVFDVLPRNSPRDGFHAESQTWQIGGCVVSRVRAPAIRVERNVTHVRRSPLHHWVITVSRHATSLVSSGNTTLSVPPGTPFVLSLADELTSERHEDQRLQLYMSRDKFADLAPALDRARGKALATPLGSLLGDYLVLLERILADVMPKDLPRLSDAIGAMVAACLAPEQDRAGSAGPQIDLVRLERVRHIVRRYLRSSALGPRLLCHRLSMSRSKLYRLMDAEGGVARYIQRQRLLEAYALLSDPAVDVPITAVAEELCFADTSGFSRAFRREFGSSPSDVRAARTAPGPYAPHTHANGTAGVSLRSLLGAL
jgi:AraC-like DNA-binding protein